MQDGKPESGGGLSAREQSSDAEAEAPAQLHNNRGKSYAELYASLGLSLPPQSELAETVAGVLAQVLAANSGRAHVKSIFDSKKIPAISIPAYLQRIVKHGRLSAETLVVAVVYLDRLADADEAVVVDAHNVHKYA